MGYSLNDLGQALTTQIQHTIMGGDEHAPPPPNTFFTWCSPGLALGEDDFDFTGEGIFNAPTAEELKQRLTHAYNMAALFDFIPNATGAYDNDAQAAMYQPDAEKHLSVMYRELLKASKVVDRELTPEETEKLERFRSKLFVTKKVKDLVTDEEKEVTEESPLLRAYNEKMAAYADAVLEYNAKRIAATAASGPEGTKAVADWALNQQTYQLKVTAAANAWKTQGYRNEVEAMTAYIDQVTQRSLLTWKQSLLEAYDKATVTSAEVAVPFQYTTMIPGNILASKGWTEIGVTHDTTQWAKKNTSTSWKAEAGVRYALFSFGGGASGTKTSTEETQEVSSFSMSFSLAQAVIVRPWFFPEFLANRGWTLHPGEGWTFGDLPSDGGDPPKGSLVGFPTQAIFIRDVKIKSADFVSAYSKATSELTAGGSIGWGPIKLGGDYSRKSSDEKFSSTTDGDTLTVPGVQIIGFINHLFGKAPNPLPELTDADFV